MHCIRLKNWKLFFIVPRNFWALIVFRLNEEEFFDWGNFLWSFTDENLWSKWTFLFHFMTFQFFINAVRRKLFFSWTLIFFMNFDLFSLSIMKLSTHRVEYLGINLSSTIVVDNEQRTRKISELFSSLWMFAVLLSSFYYFSGQESLFIHWILL